MIIQYDLANGFSEAWRSHDFDLHRTVALRTDLFSGVNPLCSKCGFGIPSPSGCVGEQTESLAVVRFVRMTQRHPKKA